MALLLQTFLFGSDSGKGKSSVEYAWRKLKMLTFLVSVFSCMFLILPQASFAASTADPNANAKTQAEYNYLVGLQNNHTLSGQYVENYADMATINTAAGKYPALLGMDYAWTPISDANIIAWSNAGGIVEVGQHFKNPVTGKLQNSDGSFDLTPVNLTQLVTPGTALNTTFKGYLDTLVTHLATFQSNNVTVILRLFHEMNGSWFWWSEVNSNTPAQFKALWIYTFNYLTATKGLHNLIWNFSPYQGPNDGPINVDNYPGSAYVDMVGVSVYYGGNTIPSVTNIPDNKPFAVNEWGYDTGGQTYNTSSYPPVNIAPMITSLKSRTPKAIYWMAWNGIYSMAYNTGVSTLLADPWVITRDEVPAFSGAPDTTAPAAPSRLSVQ